MLITEIDDTGYTYHSVLNVMALVMIYLDQDANICGTKSSSKFLRNPNF